MCSHAMVSRYQKRISGPLLDRIDIHIEVPRVEYEKLSDDRLGEPSAAVRAQVEAARARQAARFEGTRMLANADMGPGEVRDLCRLDDAGKSLLKAAMQQLHMSARAVLATCPIHRSARRIPGYLDQIWGCQRLQNLAAVPGTRQNGSSKYSCRQLP